MRAKCENAGSAPIGSHPPGRAQVHQVCVRIVRSATGNTTFPTSIFMTITLQSLRIERFKRIHDAVFDLGTWNVLVGANNSGKSSIIQGLHFAVAVFQSIGLLEKFPQSSDKPLSMSLGPNQLIYSPSDDPYSLGVRPSISLARFWCWVEFPAGDLLVRQRQGSGGRSRAGWTNTAWQQFLAPRRSLRELFEPHFLLAIHGRGCASSICCASGKSTPIRRAPSPTRARETLASRAPV